MDNCKKCETYRMLLAEYIYSVGAAEGVDFTGELLDDPGYPEEKKKLLRDALDLSCRPGDLDFFKSAQKFR